jgi:3-methyladenine DNA glycosylase AlkD
VSDPAGDEIVACLGELADPDRAVGEARYLKSPREHLGVRVPDVRRTVRTVARDVRDRRDVLTLATALWSDGAVHERCLAAVELLVARAGVLVAADLDVIERLLRDAGTWALVDPLAEKAAGDVVDRDPAAADVLDRWARDPDFWLRRSALLALLGPLKAGGGDWERFRRYADSMLDEPGVAAGGAGGAGQAQFFVRKAIGWVLRETGKRRPELVAAWLGEHGDRVPGLVRREATKYLGR